jgi:hypothetical protein
MTEKPPRSTSKERQLSLLDGAAATATDPASILYAHTVMCQTGLPYRNPGDDVHMWKRQNGHVHLAVMAGLALHPERNELVQLGLPFGPKPRLILAHLNAEALRQQSPEIEVDRSLTAFVKRLSLSSDGRTISTIKDQLARLAASRITLGIMHSGEAVTINSQIVTAFNLWFPKDDRQRVLWPSTVRLSADYFDSLSRHAVPLHDQALAALSGSAMGLDVYSWLAQRLHRIDPGKPAFVPWTALQAQFGWHYERVRKFREVFIQTLRLVHSQYKAANFALDDHGMTLRHSLPPVRPKIVTVCLPEPTRTLLHEHVG